MNNDEKKKNDSLIFFALLLFLGAGGFLFLALDEQKELANQRSAGELKPIQSDEVNFNLKTAQQRQQLDRLRVIEEINRLKPDPKAQPSMRNDSTGTISFDSDHRNQDVLEATRKNVVSEKLQLTPDEIVQGHLYELQMAKQMDEAYKKEYARRFIEYARSKGFAVKLDSQLKITSIRRIPLERTPSNMFQGAPGGKQ